MREREIRSEVGKESVHNRKRERAREREREREKRVDLGRVCA